MAERSYHAGEMVYYQGQGGNGAASAYRIIRRMPVDQDSRTRYRIKNAAESFERVALEEQLSRSP
jgi:hypothetical protein